MFYTVGEAAKRLGVAPSTLRYYDKEGLLPFVERTDGGIRMFKQSDFEGLRLIECLKKNRNAAQRHQTLYGLVFFRGREHFRAAGDDRPPARAGPWADRTIKREFADP